jgi:hypothetical protein
VVEQDKVIADLETLRGVAQAGAVVLANELRDNNDLTRAWQTEVDADLDLINDYLDFLGEQDGVIGGDYTFAEQTNADFLGAGMVIYRIGGEVFHTQLPVAIAPDDGGVTEVTGSNFFACRVVIDRLGVVTTERDDGAGQSTAEKALLHLGSVAQAANTAVLGYITLAAATGFVPGTAVVDGEGDSAFYYERQPKNSGSGLWAAQGSALVAGDGLATVAVGDTNPKVNGVRLAQITADGTLALTDADTITTTEAGGWLVLTDLAGTGFVTLSSDGVPGVTALSDTDAATALVALNLLASRLPSMFVPLGHVIVVTSEAATFTAKSTFWNATDVATTVVDQTLAAHDRTVAAASFLARKSNPPTLPDTVSADVVPAAVGSAVSTTAVDEAADMTAVTINP